GRRASTAAPVDAESTSTRARKKTPNAPDAATAQPVIAANHVTAVRPHAPKAGRRAADAFSDTIEKPAGGRRARIVTPTSAPSVDDSAVVSGVTAVTAGEVEVTVETVAVESVAGESVAGEPVAGESVPAEPAAVEPAAPAARTVSRRTLRTAAPVFDEEQASTAAPTPASVEAPAEASGTPASGTPASGTPASGTPGAPRASGRRVRRGDIAKGAFSIAAMLFATGIAVATTMPASAWHAASDSSSSSVVLVSSVTTPGQELTTSAEAAVSSVARDGYAVRDTVAELRAAGMRVADTFTNNPTGAIQWPFPVGVPISDYFGARESPGGIGSTDHKGVDFTPGQGTNIFSIADGVVSFVQSSDNGGLGVHVIVDHVIDGQKVSSVYGHMLAGSITVTEGQVVKVAQPIGQVGNTGTSTGAHLHLEIRLNGTTPVDPYAWLQTHAV
ncbi:peptidoglycan DD-metalloendopeptidase family protein, partial [Herbiconiux sp.]|uniref:peptidoglycan DD-metalloendopeptidase family protein n=1 Tax=Herbiconiux sp. TaxID=1871186 RepID=UPI0025BD552A